MSRLPRYLKASAAACGVVALGLLVWFGSDALLLGFAGVLVAIILRTSAEVIARVTRLRIGYSLAITLAALAGLLALALTFVGPHIAEQVDQLRNGLPMSWSRAQTNLRIIGGLIVTGFVGIYLAADPDLYVCGIIRLVPIEYEKRCAEVLSRTGQQLKHWLLGKMALMLFVGVATGLGLWVLQMPLILTLAILAAMLDFIPNIGPVISAVPAVLLASGSGAGHVLWVAGLYLTVQIVESYVLQPLVQQRAVSLPPAVNLLAQVLIGILFGWLGVILATPLTVVAITLIEMLYVEDALQKQQR